MLDFACESAAPSPVCGIDEAGRGPWAGPVVAAAVILPRDGLPDSLRLGLDDSKKLKPARRDTLFDLLHAHAAIGVGTASEDEIDRLDILRATLLAMARAVAALPLAPAFALVDGNRPPTLPCPVHCVVGGDGACLSIAAASIVAKVTRDRIMADLAARWPGYGWERNMGYGTAEHRAGLRLLGVTPHHRRSFKPIIKILTGDES